MRRRRVDISDVAALAGSGLASFCLVWLIFFRLSPLSGGAGFVLCWFVAFIAIYWIVVREDQGPMAAADKVAQTVVAGAALAVLIPLVLVVVFVVVKGVGALSPSFFTQTLETVGPLDPAASGGALHAIVGTLQQVGIAMLISVPLGISCAVFLNEIGGRWAHPVRLFADAMSGVPSIVAGLFVYALWIVQFGNGFSGLAAGLALSILMLPSVTRTAEEVLRLVPGGLREAALALGAPQWRTVWSVVMPTARAGLVTAVILGLARAVGETAPLIMTSFGSSALNANPLSGAQESLPLFVFNQIRSPQEAQIDRAWAGALVLIAIVLILFVLARVIGRPRAAVSTRAIPTPVPGGNENE